jgi:hypothetical protein
MLKTEVEELKQKTMKDKSSSSFSRDNENEKEEFALKLNQ